MSDFVAADDVTPKAVEWLWGERIPKGMISLIAGKPDQAKGLMCSKLAADVTMGRGGVGEPRNVIYSAMEDDPRLMTRPRLEAAGADLKRVFLARFMLPRQMEELAARIVDNEIALVIIDPITAHLAGGVSRSNDSIREVTNAMSKIGEATGVSWLIVEHALKRVSPNAHPLTAIAGSSSGIPAASRMGFVFGSDPEDADRKILACVKSNIRDKPKALAFEVDVDELPVVGEVPNLIPESEHEVEFDPRRLLSQESSGKVGRRPDKRAEAAEWLTTYLAQAGATKAGLVIEDGKQIGHTAKTTRRAADDMGVVRNPAGGGRNCTWDLNEDVKRALGVQAAPVAPTVPVGDDFDAEVGKLLGGDES